MRERFLFFLMRKFGLELDFDFFGEVSCCVAFLLFGLDLWGWEGLLLFNFGEGIGVGVIHGQKFECFIITRKQRIVNKQI